jgi:hypothetical protein
MTVAERTSNPTARIAASNLQSGVANDPRLSNPAGLTEPAFKFWGISNWAAVFSWSFIVIALAMFLAFGLLSWRARQMHHGLIIFLSVAGLTWLDPPANWATFTVYDPQFLHLPTTWAWMRLAPDVEPIIVVAAYPMYYFLISLVGYAACRRFVLRPARDGSWVSRHPLWTIFGVASVVGLMWDIPIELFMQRTHMYLYSQAIGPRLHWGHAQLPVVWTLLTWPPIAVIAVMLHRDDTGRSLVLSKVAKHLPGATRGASAVSPGRQVIAGITLLSALWGLMILSFGTLRVAHLTRPSYNTWMWPETKVYDPQGILQKAGKPGPFYK